MLKFSCFHIKIFVSPAVFSVEDVLAEDGCSCLPGSCSLTFAACSSGSKGFGFSGGSVLTLGVVARGILDLSSSVVGTLSAVADSPSLVEE